MNEEAVSPAIGIVLMVAITAVLGAIVFFITSDLANGPGVPPSVAFRQDGNQFTVVTTPEISITWGELNVMCDGTLTGLEADDNVVSAGDSFSCTDDVAVAHEPTESLLYDFER